MLSGEGAVRVDFWSQEEIGEANGSLFKAATVRRSDPERYDRRRNERPRALSTSRRGCVWTPS